MIDMSEPAAYIYVSEESPHYGNKNLRWFEKKMFWNMRFWYINPSNSINLRFFEHFFFIKELIHSFNNINNATHKVLKKNLCI